MFSEFCLKVEGLENKSLKKLGGVRARSFQIWIEAIDSYCLGELFEQALILNDPFGWKLEEQQENYVHKAIRVDYHHFRQFQLVNNHLHN